MIAEMHCELERIGHSLRQFVGALVNGTTIQSTAKMVAAETPSPPNQQGEKSLALAGNPAKDRSRD
jgi:hypothetical protein